MAWPKLLVLVRHAESEGNVLSQSERAQRGVSTHAYKLTERGRKQAEITGRFLRAKFGQFDINYVSYYRRSKETMSLMYPDALVYEDPRLAEGQRGIWNTMTEEQIRQKFPEEIERKEREGLYHYRAPEGENWPDIELRIHSFLGTLNRDCEGQSVLIVVHGHWLILFEKLVHRFSIEEAVQKYHNAIKENASATIYEGRDVSGKSRLTLTAENIVPWKERVSENIGSWEQQVVVQYNLHDSWLKPASYGKICPCCKRLRDFSHFITEARVCVFCQVACKNSDICNSLAAR